MKIHHLAIWCEDIEKVRTFYQIYFDCTSNDIYHNPAKGFTSYFLSFSKGDSKLELMHRTDVPENSALSRFSVKGLAHLAIAIGTDQDVIDLTERLRADGYSIVSEPRRTGDGYFEAAVLDPEGNYVEICAD